MKDMREHLEKLRLQVAECELIRNLATDPKKKELFGRPADHHRVLIGEIERAIADQTATPDTFLGRKTQEPFPKRLRRLVGDASLA